MYYVRALSLGLLMSKLCVAQVVTIERTAAWHRRGTTKVPLLNLMRITLLTCVQTPCRFLGKLADRYCRLEVKHSFAQNF